MTTDLLKPLTLRLPAMIDSGADIAATAVARTLRSRGWRRVLVVTSPSVRAVAETLATTWREEGTTIDIAADVPPEPTSGVCERLRSRARDFGPDAVVAIGGGSVLDVAKLVAALHGRAEPVPDFYGQGRVGSRRAGLVCVPTTAGTGSEVSPNALLFDDATGAKQAVIDPALVPDAAVVDPTLTVSLPAGLTATTGIDALAHCLEAYANRAAHPLVDGFALEGVRLIAGNLARAVADGSDLAARAAVATGSLYGGLCLGPVNTAAVHALAYPLAGEYHLPHGLSIALLLPHVVRHNLSAMPGRYAALARAMGVTEPDDAVAAAALPARLDALLAATGVPTELLRHGVAAEAVPRLAAAALKVTRLLRNNPRELDAPGAEAIYRAAL
jgi:alcohol dehydrogenase class IV